ncbi:SIMPL domain-containing protein [Actinoplanes sp. TFC3]|uniref:SIMPL domain-containing protein n=1 Tax=Actinoplanes sp. TFC3 TaxID=1710355 RepID=UPI00082AC07E|nr:SIMPL domain-containing protein [Actinoplanes sp. TFC3]
MADQPIIMVRGEAQREVPPDLAMISVTVSARDQDRTIVLTRLTERAAELRTAFDEWSGAIEKRETSGVSIRPELRRRGERVAAYTGSITTTLTVTDFTVLGDLLLRLADRDQSRVAGPWWALRPGNRADAEVRRAAVADALTRAREYADAVGARVDRLVEISDEGAHRSGMARMAMAGGGAGGDGALELEVDPEMQLVHASVIVKVTITEPAPLDQDGT